MCLDRCKALSADDVLDTAGILCGNFRIDTEFGQTFCKKFVAFVDHFRNLATGIGQIDETGVRHRNLVLLTKILHGDADTGFLETEFIGNINGSYDRKSFT